MAMGKPFVSELSAGHAVDGIFLLSEKNIANRKDGRPFLNVTLSDRTGQIRGVMWDQVETVISAVSEGDFVQVKAQIGEYRGALQMVIKEMVLAGADQVSPADFLRATSRNIEKMASQLKAMMDSMENPHLKQLLQAFWEDADFVAAFTHAPAAKHMHHAYIGGLLEHTLSMAILSRKIAIHYENDGVDRDLLLAGVILHDVGKLREMTYATHIDYTDEGRLLSHIVIGISMVDEKLKSIPDFPELTANLLKHMIVSHHGTREFGSPEPPKTLEAALLNYIDEMDARVNSIREYVAKDPSSGSWTPYHRLLERHFFKGGTVAASGAQND
ncbi:HD domain-containing protein [Desulfosarcina sp. OttesenSCG-928-A07]|nr:HD domain-containing protein [Desulfosarcina sp. OttesenSCG-928-G17]MDL2329580.1 HD domain-containing protein [Desulfosarcina sp. OttesenSCG-928-A07]